MLFTRTEDRAKRRHKTQTNQVASSREEGYRRGIMRYFGVVCKHGHGGVRYTSNGGCTVCQQARTKKIEQNNKMIAIDHLREEYNTFEEFPSDY